MKFVVAHVEKFTKNDCGGLGIHVDRKTENHSNKNIDITKSCDNVQLVENYCNSLYKAANDRIKENYKVDKAIRKDAIYCVGIVCSASSELFKDMNKEQTIQYFKDFKEYFDKKLGDNVISASVHLDEMTPHMHLYFTPLTEDGRLSAKEMCNRQFLRDMQRDLPLHLQEKGYDVNKRLIDEVVEHISKKEYELNKAMEDIQAKIDLFENLKEFKENIKKNKKLFSNKYNITADELDYIISLALPNSKFKEKSELVEKENNKLKIKNDELFKDVLSYEIEIEKYKSELLSKKEELEKTKNELETTKRQLKESQKNVTRYKSVIDRSAEATQILKNDIQKSRGKNPFAEKLENNKKNRGLGRGD